MLNLKSIERFWTFACCVKSFCQASVVNKMKAARTNESTQFGTPSSDLAKVCFIFNLIQETASGN